MVDYSFSRNRAGWLNGAIVSVPDQIADAQREHDEAGTVFPVRGPNQDVVMVQLDGEAYGLHTAGTGDIILKDAPRYALIDIHSGFVWGIASAATVLDAVKAVDASAGMHSTREYVQHSAGSRADRGGIAGYLVYAVPAGSDCDDGQDEASIAEVEACELVAVVEVRDQVQEG